MPFFWGEWEVIPNKLSIVLVISVWSEFGVSHSIVPCKYIGQVQDECSRFCCHGLNPSLILSSTFFFLGRCVGWFLSAWFWCHDVGSLFHSLDPLMMPFFLGEWEVIPNKLSIVLVISVWSEFGVSHNAVPCKHIGQVQDECSRFCFHGLNPSLILTPAFFFGARQFELLDVFLRWFHVLGDINDLCRYKDCFLLHFNGCAFSLPTLSESRNQT